MNISNNKNMGDGDQYNIANYHKGYAESKGSAIQNVLLGIVDIEEKEYMPLVEDNYTPFSIEEKIIFNKIYLYDEFIDKYRDNYSIVESRLNSLELNGHPGIRKLIIDYVAKKYRMLSCKGLTPDDIICCLDEKITQELESRYLSFLSLEEISHADSVIFHVFAKCEIFSKPPI